MSGIAGKESLSTFEVPNIQSRSESRPEKVRGFFYALNCYDDTAKRRSFLYREGLKTFALDWVRQRCKGDRRFSFSARNSFKPNKVMLHKIKEYQKEMRCAIADERFEIAKAVGSIYNHFGVSDPADFIMSLVESKVSQSVDQDMDEIKEVFRQARIIAKHLSCALERTKNLRVLEQRLSFTCKSKAEFDESLELINQSIKPSNN